MSEIKAGKASLPNLFSLPTEKNKTLSTKNSAQGKLETRDPKKLEAAKMFENTFIRQMISEMRKTVPDEGPDSLIPKSMGQKIFEDQLDDNYAEKWTENGGIGLANLIYEQLDTRYNGKPMEHAKGHPAEIMAIKPGSAAENKSVSEGIKPVAQQQKKSSDLFAQRDKDLFLLKKTNHGYQIKSREPLPEKVDLKAPLEGKVIQAAALGEGKQMVVLANEAGANLQFVHTGKNTVQVGDQIQAGQTIAQLPASIQGEGANVFFSLRQRDVVE